MYDIFLSYSSKDRERLVPLVNALEAQGWTVFWDHRSIKVAQEWHQVIGTAIQQCPCVIVAWSVDAVASRWVTEEALIARDRGVLYPIMLDPVAMPFGFNMIQSANFVGWNGKADHPEFVELKEQLSIRLGLKPIQPKPEPQNEALTSPPLSLKSADTPSSGLSGVKLLGGLGLLTAVGVGGYQFLQPDNKNSVNPVVTPVVEKQAPVAPEPVKPEPPKTYQIAINVTPANANITIDGKPYQSGQRWTAGTYTVKVEASGYRPNEGIVTVKASDIEATVVLEADYLPTMVEIPEGSFMMGCDDQKESGCQDDEKPTHKVDIKPFLLAKTEVTVAQFREFTESANYKTTAETEGSCWSYDDKGEWNNVKGNSWKKMGFDQDDNHPVACVSYDDAKAYVGWLSEKTGKEWRLPTEAEWEYAARAGTKKTYSWGEAADKGCQFANMADKKAKTVHTGWKIANCDDGYIYTSPVGSFAANSFGLHDMYGNVWEWVEDKWHDDYQGAPTDGSAWVSGDSSYRVLRGGSWLYDPQFLRSASRDLYAPGYRNGGIGFRPAQVYEPTSK